MDEQQIIRLQSSIINRLNSEQGDVFADFRYCNRRSVKIQTELRNLEEEMNDIINLEQQEE
jgi:hypothetical protein